ncbi:hypothetical protein C8F01DRAFT_1138094 [Mycena amicta]|nr:hypothetical protein C8F01DRAFT_1138094 [Mycena amicta]
MPTRPLPIRTGTYDLKMKETESEYTRYTMDLGAESPSAGTGTPPLSPVLLRVKSKEPDRPKLRRPRREPSGDCGICFEQAVNPTSTPCCGHLFCAEHIADWLHGPAADGRCPSCRVPSATPTPLSTRASSPCPSEPVADDTNLASTPTSPTSPIRITAPAALRAAGCLIVLAVLAGSGRWAV